MIAQPWLGFAVALAVGLLIGVDRERTKREGALLRPAGIRTFTLASLLGAAAVHVGGVTLLVVATLGVATISALVSMRREARDLGLTTEIGLMSMPLLGALAMSDALMAGALAAVVAVVFAVKTPLHRFVREVLTDAEIEDGLIFAIATLVVWPLLPDRYLGPLQALNPHKIWLLVILMLALGAAGHIATRALGVRFGLPLAGLASGFVSSTATIGSTASLSLREPKSLPAAAAGATFSSVATFLQLGMLAGVTSMPTLWRLAPAFAAGALAVAAYGLFLILRDAGAPAQATGEPGRAFSPWAALVLALMMAAMLLLATAMKAWLGDAGVLVGAVVAGAVDTHAAAVSVISLAASGRLTPEQTVLPVMAAMTSNAASKVVMAVSLGSREFAMRVVPGILLSLACAWVAAIALG